jgi:hypothetical protein
MNIHDSSHRATELAPLDLLVRLDFVILLLVIQIVLCQSAIAQKVEISSAANGFSLTAEQVVRNLVQMNLQRAQSLHGFQGTRLYHAEYHGLGGTRTAEMLVSMKYLSPSTKEFTIESATGSKLIIERVFKKLLEAEREALDAEMQRRSALSEENYQFTLVGYENGETSARFVLAVEPRKRDKFLYRGRIWVDAEDFAVVRLEAEPAKNPSFWTKRAEIVQEYKKVNDFWLPAVNRSVSAIRLGGHAELTIEYENYEITGVSQAVTPLPKSQMAPYPETARAQK